MDWLIQLFPRGWRIEPGTNLFKLVKVIAKRMEEVQTYIGGLIFFIPSKDEPILTRWEKMMRITHQETGEQRITNIKNKLVGEYGLFNEELVKKIIEFYTTEEADFEVSNGKSFICGNSKCGEVLRPEGAIFNVFILIKNQITNRSELEKELNEVKHTHLNLYINYHINN